MSDRQKLLSKLISDKEFRADYIRAKLDVLIPSQLRAVRLREDKTQSELAQLAEMKQARVSAMETPGRVNFSNETLVRMAATLNVGLVVKFVPFSEMLDWENNYSQDTFGPTQLADDSSFLNPEPRVIRPRASKRKNQSLIRTTMLQVEGGARTARLPDQQEGAQMKLRFNPLKLSQDENNHANTIGNSSGYVPHDHSVIREAAAAAGGQSGKLWRTNVAR